MDILSFHRKTNATVDLNAVAHNFELLRQQVAPAQICAVIKANAYGHGDVPIAKLLEEAEIPWLAVALVEEGIRLRQHGIKTPILVLGGALGNHYDALIEYDLTPSIFSQEHLRELGNATGSQTKAFHLKLDTGMSRLGLRLHELPGFLDTTREYPNLHLTGVLTHLANADLRDTAQNSKQVALFNQGLLTLEKAGLTPRWRHVSNSAGSLTVDTDHTNLVRIGLALYGLDPLTPPSETPLRPALSWKTSIIHIKSIPAGDRVSYGGNWEAQRPSLIATLPVGYADGYSRSLAGKAEVLIGDARAPIVGNICMDLCMADITDIPGAEIGDEAVLLGSQGHQTISAYELARWADTIPYEITTGISYRVPRDYSPAIKER